MTRTATFSGTITGPTHGAGRATVNKIDLSGVKSLVAYASANATASVSGVQCVPGEYLELDCSPDGGSFAGSVSIDTTTDAVGGAVNQLPVGGPESLVATCAAGSTASGSFSLSSTQANPGPQLSFHGA
jgi:hypothetical protein